MPRDDSFEFFGLGTGKQDVAGFGGDPWIGSLDDRTDDRTDDGWRLDDRTDDRTDDGFRADDRTDDRTDDVSDDDPFDDRTDDLSDDDPFDDRTDDLSDDGFRIDAGDGTLSIRLDDISDDGPLGIEEVLRIAYLYEAVLNRDGAIDLQGFNFWIDVREQGLSERGMAEQFLFSNEFRGSFGDPSRMSDRELVELCYANILGRQGDAGGIDFWAGALRNDGFERPDLLIAFVSSSENTGGLDYADTLILISDGEWGFA